MERPEAWIARMLRLIDLEREAEVEETSTLLDRLSGPKLEARGLSILRLRIVEEAGGLGGRILLTLEKTTGEPLPPGRIGPGDIVRLVPQDIARLGPAPVDSGRADRGRADRGRADRGRAGGGKRDERSFPSGTVWRRTARALTVAFDDLPDDGVVEGTIRLDRVANDITYRRMRGALERLRGAERGRAAQLREILLGEREPRFDAAKPLAALDPRLNPYQVEAVRFALGALDVALIHGPPGTGKTTAVAELIRQAARRGERILATAPSNVAVDNLAETLAEGGVSVVRVGHPARLLPSVVELSLDARVAGHPHTRAALDLRRDLAKAVKRLRRARDFAERRSIRGDLRSLRGSIADAESAAVKAVLDGADVVLATCVGADDPVLAGRKFDLAVIDEAAQALEPACWIPIQKAGRVVLAGDHRQLPPTVISREAERGGLGTTLFDRLMAREAAPSRGAGATEGRPNEERSSRLLVTQYRMHRAIMEYPSRALYDGRLQADPSVAEHLLRDLPGIADGEASSAPLVFVDTAGCGYDEELEAEGESRENAGEAEAASRLVGGLLALGLPAREIGVIAPYSAQVRKLRERLAEVGPDLEIDTVDGFQGREKEALVISLVRSNARGDVGFLADVRRTNVAITRARRHLAVIGDSATVARDAFIAGFIAHCESIGAYRSEWEYR